MNLDQERLHFGGFQNNKCFSLQKKSEKFYWKRLAMIHNKQNTRKSERYYFAVMWYYFLQKYSPYIHKQTTTN